MGDEPISLANEADQRWTARRLFARLEAVHTLAYTAPDVLAAQERIGLEDRMAGYLATRLAPMGPVGPELALAAVYGFAPRLLARALPRAWERAEPEAVLGSHLAAMTVVLHGLWTGMDDEVARAAELAREAALLHPIVGRPLAAAWSSVPWSTDHAVVLWQASTRVRESRGGGHVAALMDAGIGAAESHLLARGDSVKLRRVLTPIRGFTDAEWDAAVEALRVRGLLDGDGRRTEAGDRLHAHVEERTDAMAAPPWAALGEAMTERLRRTLDPLVARVVDAGILPGVVTRMAGL